MLASLEVVDLVALFAALLRPGEMSNGNNEEATTLLVNAWFVLEITNLLELSAIPARALYHARKAAMRPKAPPAMMQPS